MVTPILIRGRLVYIFWVSTSCYMAISYRLASITVDLPAVHAGQHCLNQDLDPDSVVLMVAVEHHTKFRDLHLYQHQYSTLMVRHLAVAV